ncbi:MAG TPA: GGDEF domain-containing protein [Thermoanaerobaculia bacterium]|nr:GGDEF domain-containing protein [Thermoanaerobaculia bacterium]
MTGGRRNLVSSCLAWLDARSSWTVNLLALLLLILISAVDYLTPPQISTFVFYIAPIGFTAWFGGRAGGQTMALLSTATWIAKDVVFRGELYAEPWILLWNGAARLITFSFVAWLITEVRLRLRREQRLARTDALTGLLNVRAFREELELELVRATRADQALTFVFLDLDNFKAINDAKGHPEGDRALQSVARILQDEVRRSDVLGRLGGDEFAVVLPATDTAEASTVVEKLRRSLKEEMTLQAWPVTFSIGVITCPTPSVPSADALIQAADRLMYAVKAAGKDAVLHRVWPVAA